MVCVECTYGRPSDEAPFALCGKCGLIHPRSRFGRRELCSHCRNRDRKRRFVKYKLPKIRRRKVIAAKTEVAIRGVAEFILQQQVRLVYDVDIERRWMGIDVSEAIMAVSKGEMSAYEAETLIIQQEVERRCQHI